VLSTSWVSVLGFSATAKRLPEGLQQRVVGATFHQRHTPEWGTQTRYRQIQEHVVRHGLGVHWLAVDDDTEGWPAIQRNQLVSPQPAVGLQPWDIEMLVARLQQLTSGTNCSKTESP
jgi:hypothetical protein